MLDFSRGKFHKYRLSQVPPKEFEEEVSPLLTDRESVLCAFKAGRDGVLFTTQRLITIDHENGRKTDITSIPYIAIDVFSVENAGWLDRDAELNILIKGVGKFCFEFDRAASMSAICKHLSVCKFN